MTYQSEAELEKLLLSDLVQYNRYEPVTIKDEADLEENFRTTIQRFNQDKLQNEPLTDKEFERILVFLKGNNVFQCAKLLRDKIILQRDSGEEVYLELYNTKGNMNNIYQVSSQVTATGRYTNRYDVTFLANGLPIMQLELKRRGLDIKEAFNQIERYRKHSYQGLYRFIQMFIISNGVDTKYFANSDGVIHRSQTFFWSDDKNNRITNLNDFADTFLHHRHVWEMITKYMVINETDKLLMVMRPYQVYAVKKLVERAQDSKKNGFIWHSTGSGKTLTSFKASQIIAQEKSVDKVFFLVDRKDLDTQTTEEFNKFEADSVDKTDNTSTLIEHIKDDGRKLILTTIQKMNRAVSSERYAKVMEQYQDKKVVFVIDECHRSQFGEMHKAVSKHFKNAQYLGFTGTPIFPENKSSDGRTTADLFDECLHTYLLKDAIKDNNVLGFLVEYIKTFDVEYDIKDPARIQAINTAEVFEDQKRIDLVVDHIIGCHDQKTNNRQYCGIFATSKIDTLVKYYDTFRAKHHNLKVAAIFTYGANEESEGKTQHSRDHLERMIEDYNAQFDTNYSTDTFSSYYRDVSRKAKTGQIDILLVVNMFLTGFDSKPLNTLYVDKNLEYHNLLQAFSRTNRVEKTTKPYGNIVCYRNLKNKTDEAICIYSQTENVNDVLLKDYTYYLDQFWAALAKLKQKAPSPKVVDNMESEDDKKEFILLFRELSRILLVMKSFVEFEFDESVLGISDQSYQDYKSKYLLLYDESKRTETRKTSILSDVDFDIEIVQTDRINVAYIMNLIKNIDLKNKKAREKDSENILKELDRSDNPELRLKADLIRDFVTKVVPTLHEESHIIAEYGDYENLRRSQEIDEFAKKNDLDPEFLRDELSEYEYSERIRTKEIIGKLEGRPFLVKKRLKQEIIDFITKQVAKYQ